MHLERAFQPRTPEHTHDWVCPECEESCPKHDPSAKLFRREHRDCAQAHDPENIYDLATMRQSIEEDRR